MCWTACFSKMKHCFTWVLTLVVNTAQYGVLKTHMLCMKLVCICQRFVFGAQCLENELWDHCCLKKLQESIQILYSVCCCAGRKWIGLLISARWDETPHSKKQLSSRTSSVITLSGADFGHHEPQTVFHLLLFCEALNVRVYSNNPRIIEDLKCNNEQVVSSIDQKLFKKLQKTRWRGWMLIIKQVEDTISICCNYTLFITFLLYFKK